MHPRHLGAPLLVLCLALACSVAAKQAREFTGELFVGLGVVAAGLLAAIGARAAQSEEAIERRKADLAGATTSVDEVAPRLVDGAARLARASEEHAAHARDLAAALAAIGPKVDALAARAAEAGKALAEIDPSGDAGAPALAELGAIAREATTAAGEAAAAVREVARRVEALGRSADEASASTVALGGAIDRLHASADETARLSEQVAADAEKGAEAIEQTLAEIVRIKDSSLEAATVIASLGTRIDAVGQILAVIDDVAEQTNLLALNAAIIAAQAGEHGKGFAVVADEIKDLAERAGGSTKEISDLVKTIQAESRNATVAATRGARDVERGVEVSADAERALGKIVDSARRSTQMARAIARALAEQAQGSKQVGDAASRVAEGAHQVANAVAQEARAADAVAKGVERLRGAAQAVERSSAEHARGVRAASEAIGEVSVVAQAIDAARRADAREADRALESARRAEELARANEDAARRVAAASERLRRAVSG